MCTHGECESPRCRRRSRRAPRALHLRVAGALRFPPRRRSYAASAASERPGPAGLPTCASAHPAHRPPGWSAWPRPASCCSATPCTAAMAGPGTGSLRSPALRTRIEDFVTWANAEAARHGPPGEVRPPDPHGAVGTRPFRRTLAWHIARRPGELVALAIPYSHLRTALVYEGYAARSRDGIHELIDIETVRAVADTVADLIDDLPAAASPARPPGAPSRQRPRPALRGHRHQCHHRPPPPRQRRRPAVRQPASAPACATTSTNRPRATALESATPRGSITACPNIRSSGVHRDSSAAESDVAWSTTPAVCDRVARGHASPVGRGASTRTRPPPRAPAALPASSCAPR